MNIYIKAKYVLYLLFIIKNPNSKVTANLENSLVLITANGLSFPTAFWRGFLNIIAGNVLRIKKILKAFVLVTCSEYKKEFESILIAVPQ